MSGCHNRTMYDQCETENYHDKHVKCGNYRLEEFPYERNDCQKWSVDLETKFRLEPSNFLGGPGCGQANPCRTEIFFASQGFADLVGQRRRESGCDQEIAPGGREGALRRCGLDPPLADVPEHRPGRPEPVTESAESAHRTVTIQCKMIQLQQL